MSYWTLRNLGAAPPLDKNGGTQTVQQSTDAAYFKQLNAKYGVALAYQIMKGVKTEAQAAAELAAKVAAQAPGIINTIVNTVKNNWPVFAVLGLIVFGPSLFKSRR